MYLSRQKKDIGYTGSVPTENLPEKSHDAPKRKRRPPVRKVDTPDIDQPSTLARSGWSEPLFLNMEDFTMQLRQKDHPWKIDKTHAGEIRIELENS